MRRICVAAVPTHCYPLHGKRRLFEDLQTRKRMLSGRTRKEGKYWISSWSKLPPSFVFSVGGAAHWGDDRIFPEAFRSRCNDFPCTRRLSGLSKVTAFKATRNFSRNLFEFFGRKRGWRVKSEEQFSLPLSCLYSSKASDDHTPSSETSASKAISTEQIQTDQQEVESSLPSSLAFYDPVTLQDPLVKSEISRKQLLHWYPGHIARAERELGDYVKLADVIIDVRDARIPDATTNAIVKRFVKQKPRVLALTRIDQASVRGCIDWKRYYMTQHRLEAEGVHQTPSPESWRVQPTPVVFLNARDADRGVILLHKAILKAGRAVNERRARLDLLPRPIRAIVIGYPNVGKSALINRLLKRKKTRSFNTPGVTRKIQWVRLRGDERTGAVAKQIDLLDTPGIIPSILADQNAAWLLAMCNDIAEAAFDISEAAVHFIDQMFQTWKQRSDYVPLGNLRKRYGVDPLYYGLDAWQFCGDFYLEELSCKRHNNDLNAAAFRIITDFRKGYLGKMTLEVPLIKQPSSRIETRIGGKSQHLLPSINQPTPNSTEDTVSKSQLLSFQADPNLVFEGEFDGW